MMTLWGRPLACGWPFRPPWFRLAAALLLLAALYTITIPAEPALRLCAFHWLTGRPCPLCGLTRALFALGKGHLREAIAFNALSPMAFAMIFTLFWPGRLRTKLWTAALPAFALYGLCRLFTTI